MSDIEIGSVWVGKTSDDIDCTVLSVMDNEVKVECIDRGNWFYYPVYDFLSMYKLKDDKADMVNHPPHYKDASGIECIEVTKHMSFLGGNCFKYLYRAGSKGDAIEDLKKAAWYAEQAWFTEEVTDIRLVDNIIKIAEHRNVNIADAMYCIYEDMWTDVKKIIEDEIARLESEANDD